MIYEVAAGVVLGLTIFYGIVFLIGLCINWIADLRYGKEPVCPPYPPAPSPLPEKEDSKPFYLIDILKEKIPNLESNPEEKTSPRNLKPDDLKAMFSRDGDDY